MRTAGRIEFTSQTRSPRTNYAGICMALPSADQLSRTNFSFLLITRASALISQARRLQIPSSPPLSATGTLALSVQPALTLLESALGRVSYITRAHPLVPRALLLHPPRRIAA